MDARKGLITEDLGEVLWAYNQICNYHPEISFERILPEMISVGSTHHFASCLGIFGNLMTCTLAHGLAMFQLVELEDELNIAGDDGAIVETQENERHIDTCIKELGRDQKEKRFASDETGCICLKRPLMQLPGKLIHHGLAIIPPSLITIAKAKFDYQDPRYPSVGLEETAAERLSKVGRELMRFLRSVYRAQFCLTKEELKGSLKYLEAVCQYFGIEAREGCIPQCGDAYQWPARLERGKERDVDAEAYFSLDPLIRTAMQRYNGVATVSSRGVLPTVKLEDYQYAGSKFRSNSSPQLGFVQKLGLISSEVESRVVTGEEGLRILTEQLLFSKQVIYEWTVLSDIPFHLL
jgi:hypothetical protein